MKYAKVPPLLFFLAFFFGSLFWLGDNHQSPSLVTKFKSEPQATASVAQTSKREPAAVKEVHPPAEIEKNVENSKDTIATALNDHFSHFQECLKDEHCHVDQEIDPRSRELSIANELAAKLEKANLDLATSPVQSAEIGEIARRMLSVREGRVKEGALKLMLTQEVAAENIDAVSEGILDFHDSNLVDLAIEELKRHLDSDHAETVHHKIRQTLLTGSLLVRQRLSEKLSPFINEGSYDFYEKTLSEPSLDSQIKKNLQSSLQEWQMAKKGG